MKYYEIIENLPEVTEGSMIVGFTPGFPTRVCGGKHHSVAKLRKTKTSSLKRYVAVYLDELARRDAN